MLLLSKLVNAEDRVIDIGGNWGIYAYALSALGSRLAVFEPNPQCFRALNSWASGKKNVDVYAVALSSQHGQGLLHIPVDVTGQEHDASASLESRRDEATRCVEVEITTLDSFGFQDVKFIKIDVEGHELDVLKGATKTIASSMPVMLIEIEQRYLLLFFDLDTTAFILMAKNSEVSIFSMWHGIRPTQTQPVCEAGISITFYLSQEILPGLQSLPRGCLLRPST